MADVTRGRIDGVLLNVLAVHLAERATKRYLEPRVGVPLWDNGLGEIIETAVEESSIPKRPITAVDLARAAGILKRKPQKKQKEGTRSKDDVR